MSDTAQQQDPKPEEVTEAVSTGEPPAEEGAIGESAAETVSAEAEAAPGEPSEAQGATASLAGDAPEAESAESSETPVEPGPEAEAGEVGAADADAAPEAESAESSEAPVEPGPEGEAGEVRAADADAPDAESEESTEAPVEPGPEAEAGEVRAADAPEGESEESSEAPVEPGPEAEAGEVRAADADAPDAESEESSEAPVEPGADGGGDDSPDDQPAQPSDSPVNETAEAFEERFGVESKPEASDTEDDRIRAVLEALIYITDEPLSAKQIADALGQSVETVEKGLAKLAEEYARPDRGLSIREIAGGYKMSTKPEFHEEIRTFVKKLKPPLKLSLAALETLAVIAYKQPITGPEIMEIRGVQGGGVLKTLLDRKLITTSGRKQVVGRPVLYKTTKEFLVQFGLKDLAELPTLKEFEEWSRLALGSDEQEAPEPPPGAEATEPGTEPVGATGTEPAPENEPAAEQQPAGESTADEEPAPDPAPPAPPEEEPQT